MTLEDESLIQRVRKLVASIRNASEQERNDLPDHIVTAADDLHRKFQERDRDA